MPGRTRTLLVHGRRPWGVLGAVALLVLPWPRPAAAQEQPFHGEIEVSRVVTRVRVVDHTGAPIRGLGPADFEVTIDGEDAVVEAAEWIEEGPLAEEPPPPQASPPTATPPLSEPRPPARGRLLVLLFQTDLNEVRLTGLMRMDERAAELVRTLGPEDRVAVAVFGSHLELHSDFTGDVEAVASRLGILDILAARGAPSRDRTPSLARHLDAERARRAATIEAALEVLGDALAEIPGTKEIILFGWGAGRYDAHNGLVFLGLDYDRALAALTRAEATVFCLDVTDADYHSLEKGLRRVAEDTGGLYLKTHLFPGVAMMRLTQALSGYYELVLLPPAMLGPRFRVRVRVPGAEVSVRKFQLAAPEGAGAPSP